MYNATITAIAWLITRPYAVKCWIDCKANDCLIEAMHYYREAYERGYYFD